MANVSRSAPARWVAALLHPAAGGSPVPRTRRRQQIFGILSLGLLLSWFCFAMEPLATDQDTPLGMRVRPAEESTVPIWANPAAYAAFWAHRLSGDLDYSVVNPAYPTGRPGRGVQAESKARFAQTLVLLLAALGVALVAGTALGLVVRAWKRRLHWGGELPVLEAAGQIPLATFTVFVLLAMDRWFGVQPNFGRYQGFLAIAGWGTLIFPAMALALPLLPRVARFWIDAPLRFDRATLIGWAGGLRLAAADAFLAALGWVPAVEVAFSYPGLGERAVKAAMEVWIVQTWLLFVTLMAFLAVALGGRTRLRLSGPLSAPAASGAAAPAGGGWFRALVERDGFVLGLYGLAAVAGALALAEQFPGMQQAVNLRVLEFRPASPDYPFGSDGTGRNMWRLMILGGRQYIPVALASAAAAVAAAWALGMAARRWSRGGGALAGLRALLSIYPAILWGVVIVFLAGRGTWAVAVGLFFAVLPAALEPFVPAAGGAGPALWWRQRGKARAVVLMGTALASAAYSFLVVVHMAFIGVGERYAGTEWSAALGETFARQHPDWTLAAAPELALLLTALALFVPGQIMLNLAARGAPESPPDAGRSG